MDLRAHEGSAGMMRSMYAKRDVTKYYFTLPNQIFDLGLHYIEVAIYAYLLRIENRKTFECVTSYPKIARKLGLSVNTVAKYVSKLEEHGLITTEHTNIITKAGLKRNGSLKYHIENIQYAVDLFNECQMAGLQRISDIQKTQALAEKKGVEFHPAMVSAEGGDQIGA